MDALNSRGDALGPRLATAFQDLWDKVSAMEVRPLSYAVKVFQIHECYDQTKLTTFFKKAVFKMKMDRRLESLHFKG